MSCVAQHGQEFNYDETLNDHHNGRCVPVPKTISYRDLGLDLPDPVAPFETGEQWFARQPEAVQRQMMGVGKYEAWRGEKFDFRELSQISKREDPVYGYLRVETPLKDLVK